MILPLPLWEGLGGGARAAHGLAHPPPQHPSHEGEGELACRLHVSSSMNEIIAFALKQRVLMVILMLAVFAGGIIGFLRLNIEAYPDPVPPLVDIVAQSSGQSAEEMERYVTIPTEIQMAGIPNVTAIRSISLFGLSDIKVQFTYDFTYEQAEQWVINRLAQLPPLPNNVVPQISPESPIGEILRYRVVGPPGYTVTDLKTIEDWMLERRFKAVPGVIDVTGWGGKTKTYEVTIDQDKLLHYGLTIPQVLAAINNANINVGGQTVNFGPQAAVVRGVGLIHSVDDIANTMLSANNGSPVLVQRRRHGDRRQRAAARHRRAGQRQRHRAGHRADAARRREPADHPARRGADASRSTPPASCRPACGWKRSTTARS